MRGFMGNFNKGEKLYEGKAKILYSTDDPKKLIMYYKDDATAFDGAKKGTILQKGVVNNAITEVIYKMLEKNGIKTHYLEKLSDREALVRKVKIMPIEVVVRNIAAGSICKKLGIKEGLELKPPILEFFYKNDELHDPPINEYHVKTFGWASDEDVKTIKKETFKVNDLLLKFFDDIGIRLVDFKLEFGKQDEKIFLADEFSPDGSRLWDKETGKVLDKDRFRKDLGNVDETYREVYKRVCKKELK
jgi:phosphoribosylaminoimidazole-succinocarboxamide synthase